MNILAYAAVAILPGFVGAAWAFAICALDERAIRRIVRDEVKRQRHDAAAGVERVE